MSDGQNLESRVAIIAGPNNRSENDIRRWLQQPVPHVGEFVFLDSINSAEFDQYNAVVITDQTHLDHQAVKENFLTPVIYYSDADAAASAVASLVSTDADKREFLRVYNLCDVALGEGINKAIKVGVETAERIQAYLSHNSKGIQILERQDPPRFANALAVVERHEKAFSAADSLNRGLPAHLALWSSIEKTMLVYDKTGDAELEKRIAGAVVSFLDAYPDYALDKTVFLMGDGEHGEESMNKVQDVQQTYSQAISWLAFRLFKGKGNLTSKQISEQRVRDARHMNQFREFKSPLMLRPLHFDNHPELGRDNTSLVITQYIPIVDLYKVLQELNDAHGSSDKNKVKVHNLRKALLEKYVDDTVFWINRAGPTSIKKPTPAELVEYYRARIADVPDAFERRTAVEFSGLEMKLWEETTKVFGAMRVEEKHIVRNRDTSLANARLKLPKRRMSVDEYLSLFGVTGEGVDSVAVNETFYNVDMQIRYGHVLEDLAQIITFYEASFLFRNNHSNKLTPHPKRVPLLRKRFFDGIENQGIVKDLRNDEVTFHLMLLYRAVRKMSLFTDYWARTCLERENNKISQDMLMKRKSRFTDNVIHHYLLAKGLSSKVSLELSKVWKASKDYAADYPVVDEIKKALYAGDYQKVLDGIKEGAPVKLSDNARHYVRSQVMHKFMEKIEQKIYINDKNNARMGLKYCPPEN